MQAIHARCFKLCRRCLTLTDKAEKDSFFLKVQKIFSMEVFTYISDFPKFSVENFLQLFIQLYLI